MKKNACDSCDNRHLTKTRTMKTFCSFFKKSVKLVQSYHNVDKMISNLKKKYPNKLKKHPYMHNTCSFDFHCIRSSKLCIHQHFLLQNQSSKEVPFIFQFAGYNSPTHNCRFQKFISVIIESRKMLKNESMWSCWSSFKWSENPSKLQTKTKLISEKEKMKIINENVRDKTASCDTHINIDMMSSCIYKNRYLDLFGNHSFFSGEKGCLG